MIRIAIVEDDDSYIRALTGYLEQYGEQHSLSFHTTIFHDAVSYTHLDVYKRQDLIHLLI